MIAHRRIVNPLKRPNDLIVSFNPRVRSIVAVPMNPDAIVSFWRAAGPKHWFGHHIDVDAEIRDKFFATHDMAARGELSGWEATSGGALALVIVLDQFSRNLFRGTPAAFENDAQARTIADRSLTKGFDGQVDPSLKAFFYLPFMHSEAIRDQDRCVALYKAAGDADGLKFAQVHREIIARFGRFPHRNPILGRPMRPDEQGFLDAGGFTG